MIIVGLSAKIWGCKDFKRVLYILIVEYVLFRPHNILTPAGKCGCLLNRTLTMDIKKHNDDKDTDPQQQELDDSSHKKHEGIKSASIPTSWEADETTKFSFEDISVATPSDLPQFPLQSGILTPRTGSLKPPQSLSIKTFSSNVESNPKYETTPFPRPLPPLPPKPPAECPLLCCFYAVFDNSLGPKIAHQSPKGFMDQSISVSMEDVHAKLEKSFREFETKYGGEQASADVVSIEQTKDGTSGVSDKTSGRDTSSLFIPKVSKSSGCQLEGTVKSSWPDSQGESPASLSIFDSCSTYIITGQELSGSIINVSTHEFHVLTRPTVLTHEERYERNTFLFSVGFVLRRSLDPRPFRPVLSQIADTLRDMELEEPGVISSASVDANNDVVPLVLDWALQSLNSGTWECNLYLNPAHALHVKVFSPPRAPFVAIPEYAVPIWVQRPRANSRSSSAVSDSMLNAQQSRWSSTKHQPQFEWDLAINWVSLHIDGRTTARMISEQAEVDLEMVQACLRVLCHHGVIALVDMFFFTNRYECTEQAGELLSVRTSTNDTTNSNHISSRTSSLERFANTVSPNLLEQAVEYCTRRPTNATGQSSQYNFSPSASPTTSSGWEWSLQQTTNTSNNSSTTGGQVSVPVLQQALCELYLACHRGRSLGQLWMSLLGKTPLQGERRLHKLGIPWKKVGAEDGPECD